MPTITPIARAIFEAGKLQIVVARRAGIHETRLSKIVNGHVPANEDEQKALARVLRRPRHELFPVPASEASA